MLSHFYGMMQPYTLCSTITRCSSKGGLKLIFLNCCSGSASNVSYIYFYFFLDLNLLDWNKKGSELLAVALGPSVYLWCQKSGETNILCDIQSSDNFYVTSIKWAYDSNYLAIGSNNGSIQVHRNDFTSSYV